jgi:hypothetical protein
MPLQKKDYKILKKLASKCLKRIRKQEARQSKLNKIQKDKSFLGKVESKRKKAFLT